MKRSPSTKLSTELSQLASPTKKDSKHIQEQQQSHMATFISTVLSTIIHLLLVKLVGFAITLCKLHVFAKRTLAKQGIHGPATSSWLFGNAAEIRSLSAAATSKDMETLNHNLVTRLLPVEHTYSSLYGKRFLAWMVGWEPSVNLAEPRLIHEALNSPDFEKSGIQTQFMMPMFGKGIIMAREREWESQRKLTNPAFNSSKIKMMQETMSMCGSRLVDRWSRLIENEKNEIEVHTEFNLVSADIITRTAFGNNFDKKEEYIRLEHELQEAVMKQTVLCLLPGYRYLPTEENRRIRKINSKIRACLEELIRTRLERAGDDPDRLGDDILGLLLSAATTKKRKGMKLNMSKTLLIDECKCFFFAGHETTASLLTWSTMLLALSPDWQRRAREEVRELLQTETSPTPQLIAKLKIVGAILSETLRLYPPALRLRRKASKDTRLGEDLLIPGGVSVDIPILMVHHDKEIWGPDAVEFNPERFLDGTVPVAGSYFPFGAGPRVCIGRSIALTEAKTILCMLLDKFSWEISPRYRHAPHPAVSMYPRHGLQLIVSFA